MMNVDCYDISDLTTSIEVWFTVLAWFDPATDWSWDNPNLQQWMLARGYRRRTDIPPAGLWLLNWSLERRYRVLKGELALSGDEIL
jgi:hypothetical protein